MPADQKESEERDKFLDLAREQKTLWNMKVTVIVIVVGALWIIPQRIGKGTADLKVGGQVVTIQITTLIKSSRILRRVLEICRDLLSLRFQSENACVKKSQKSK